MSKLRGTVLAHAAPWLLLLPVLCHFFDVLFKGRVLYERDILGVYYAQAEAFVRCVASGSWPLWDPWLGFGQPLLASPSAQVLYPWTWLNLFLSPGTYYTVFAVSHVWLSGVGTFLLARQLRLSTAASLLAGAIWMSSGPFLSLVSLWHHFTGAALLPWVLLASEKALEGGGRRRAIVWGAAVALQSWAGSADVLAMTLLLQAGLLLRHLARDRSRARLSMLLATTAPAALLAVSLAAPQWWPSIEVLRASSRADLPGSYRTYWSLPPLGLLQAFLPVLPRDLPLRPDVRERLFEGREPFLNSLYLGLTTLPIVLAAFAGRRRRLALALGAVALAASAFALGRHGSVYGMAVALLPPLRVFRYPVKAVLLTTFAWAILAGLGLDAWRASKALGKILAAVGLLLGLGALLVGGAAPSVASRFLVANPLELTLGEASASVERALVMAATLALVGAALLLTAAWRGSAASVVLVVALDLTLAAQALNPSAPREVLARPPAVLGVLRPDEGLTRLYSFDYQRPIPGKTHRRAEAQVPFLPPQLPLPSHLRGTLANYGLLPTGTLARFGLFGSYDWDLLGLSPAPRRDLVAFFLIQEDSPGFRRLLQLGSVSYVIALHREGLEDLEPVASLGSPFTEFAIRVYRVPDRLPRAYAVGGARVAQGGEARMLLVDPGLDPRREVVLPEGEPSRSPPSFAGHVEIASYRPDRVRLVAELSARGFVVLTDAYDPGWKVRVDGRSAPLLRANEIFRAVEVPAGRHELEFVYRPRSVLIGLLAAGLALVACAVWARHGRVPRLA